MTTDDGLEGGAGGGGASQGDGDARERGSAERVRRQADPGATDGEGGGRGARKGKDAIRGRDFTGANIAATEREQTLDRERVARGLNDEDEFITEGELEARERDRERNED